MSAEGPLDRLLDRTIAPGYTNVGYALRRLSWPKDDPHPGVLTGRRALVTGAGGGLGEATALGLARLGATVHLLGRSPERTAPAAERINRALAEEGLTAALHLEACDVSDLSAVRAFAENLVRRLDGGALDVLVHNAGLMPPTRTTSVDGHELTLATHVLGPILMTDLLLPLLGRSKAGARVILVSSGGQYSQTLPADDLEFMRGDYKGTVAYARTKRVQVELTPVLGERWADHHVAVYAMHPGWADTPGVAESLPGFRAVTRPFLRTPAAGADTIVWLAATEPTPPTATFWQDRQQRPTSYLRRTRPTREQVDSVWRQVRAAIDLD